MTLIRDCGPYTILGLYWDMVYGSNFVVRLVLKVCLDSKKTGGFRHGRGLPRAKIQNSFWHLVSDSAWLGFIKRRILNSG